MHIEHKEAIDAYEAYQAYPTYAKSGNYDLNPYNPIYLLYHYTSTEVLDNLLDNGTFRASNVFYLNDAEEYREGVESLKNAFNSIPNDIFDAINIDGRSHVGIFSISFSQEKDSLYQWVTYAKESGVAIELDETLLRGRDSWLGIEKDNDDSVRVNDKEKPNYKNLLYFHLDRNLKPVKYASDEYQNSTKKNTNLTRESLMWLASYHKQEGFAQEKEVRLSTFAMCRGNKKAKVNYYRMGKKGVLRPYLDIVFGRANQFHDEEFEISLPLKSITIGPSSNQQAVFDSVVHRLRYGGNDVLYNYNDEKKGDKDRLKKNFCDFIKEILEWLCDQNITKSHEFTEKYDPGKSIEHNLGIIDSDCKIVNSIVKTILDEWIDENQLNREEYCDWSSLNINDEQEQRLMCKIYNNFYFSKKGVIVRKSKIPYIF